jgi:hypothetical protein
MACADFTIFFWPALILAFGAGGGLFLWGISELMSVRSD